MGDGHIDGDVPQLVQRSGEERSAGSGDDQAIDLFSAMRLHKGMKGTVLTIDRDDGNSLGFGEIKEDVASHDDTLLVRKGHILPTFNRNHRWFQSTGTCDTVEYDIGIGSTNHVQQAFTSRMDGEVAYVLCNGGIVI
jgi:hypothetical protein